MAEEEKEGQQEETTSGKGKKSGLKWVIALFVVIIIGVGAGVVGWKYYQMRLSGPSERGETEAVQEPGIWAMNPIVVNLMDDNGERYLKTTLQIEVSSQECMAELERLKPKVTDNILVLLSSKRYKEIAGFEGKQNLRDEIAVRLNRYLAKGQVRRIYFTEFLIQ